MPQQILITAKDLAKKYQLVAKKSLGQNFIFDQNFTNKIVKIAGDITNKTVIEIGPGPGGLTLSILIANPKKLIAIEKDRIAVEILKDLANNFPPQQLEIINQDALSLDLETLTEDRFKIIANLPYNIGTALLIKWLKNLSKIDSIHIMLQKEVARRIVAKVGDSCYGRLAVIANYLCDTKILMTVPPTVFTPQPKVDSAIVELIPKKSCNILQPQLSLEILEKATAILFNQPRKMLKSPLKKMFGNDYISIMQQLIPNLNTSLRPQNLAITDCITIAKYYQETTTNKSTDINDNNL